MCGGDLGLALSKGAKHPNKYGLNKVAPEMGRNIDQEIDNYHFVEPEPEAYKSIYAHRQPYTPITQAPQTKFNDMNQGWAGELDGAIGAKNNPSNKTKAAKRAAITKVKMKY